MLITSILYGCSFKKKASAIHKSAAIATIEIIQPFTQDDHLTTIKILKINECKLEGTCSIIPLNQEIIASFIFTHKYTGDNKNFKALKEHLPGVKSGSKIEAYIITERQKHGKLLTNIYEYSVLE